MDTSYLFDTAAAPPDERTTDKAHGRLEVREIRVSTELVGYSDMPGLAQVAEVRTKVTVPTTGQVREQVSYLFTSLTPTQASPARLPELSRGHWGIENRLFHVKDDSFGEDRHVVLRRHSGTNLCALRNTALSLLRGSSALWHADDYLPARSQYVRARPSAVLNPRNSHS